MMMTNGNLPLTDSQKSALIDFVKGGGGFIGVHCAALTLYNYPEFGEMLGGYFRRTAAPNRIVVLKVEDSEHPATRMLGDSWPILDEFYHPVGAWSGGWLTKSRQPKPMSVTPGHRTHPGRELGRGVEGAIGSFPKTWQSR